MPIATKLDPIRKDFQIIVDEALSDKGKSAAIASFARAQLKDGQDINRRALGRVPDHETYVDGRRSENLESVNPRNGMIVFEFDLQEDAFIWIHEMLMKHSPILTGQYQASHLFFVDGSREDPTRAQLIENEAYFINAVPYARKIERGLSNQAPDGVYQVVADMAKRRFSNSLSIRFSYRSLAVGKGKLDRQPAIVLKPR
jgi:hypothetical protein